jgi:hypothetical protein
MSPLDWGVFAFMTALTIAGARGVVCLWRRETTFYDSVPLWWLWGEVLWRGFVRCVPVAVVTGVVGLVAWGASTVVPEEEWGDFARPWWYVLPVLGALGALGALMTTIALFNRPKAPVPPHLRDEPGVLRALRGKRRAA